MFRSLAEKIILKIYNDQSHNPMEKKKNWQEVSSYIEGSATICIALETALQFALEDTLESKEGDYLETLTDNIRRALYVKSLSSPSFSIYDEIETKSTGFRRETANRLWSYSRLIFPKLFFDREELQFCITQALAHTHYKNSLKSFAQNITLGAHNNKFNTQLTNWDDLNLPQPETKHQMGNSNTLCENLEIALQNVLQISDLESKDEKYLERLKGNVIRALHITSLSSPAIEDNLEHVQSCVLHALEHTLSSAIVVKPTEEKETKQPEGHHPTCRR